MTLEGADWTANFIRLGRDTILQRLFSTFPDGWPGFGLLLLRLSLGTTLICLGAATLPGEAATAISAAQQIIGAAVGVFVIAGLWTPAATGLAALDQIWVALSFTASQRGSEWIHVLLGVLCASVAMLGPGAWSMDARLFGRKRFPAHQGRLGGHPPKG